MSEETTEEVFARAKEYRDAWGNHYQQVDRLRDIYDLNDDIRRDALHYLAARREGRRFWMKYIVAAPITFCLAVLALLYIAALFGV